MVRLKGGCGGLSPQVRKKKHAFIILTQNPRFPTYVRFYHHILAEQLCVDPRGNLAFWVWKNMYK